VLPNPVAVVRWVLWWPLSVLVAFPPWVPVAYWVLWLLVGPALLIAVLPVGFEVLLSVRAVWLL
jgi:hypothetical protein